MCATAWHTAYGVLCIESYPGLTGGVRTALRYLCTGRYGRYMGGAGAGGLCGKGGALYGGGDYLLDPVSGHIADLTLPSQRSP